MDADTIMRRLHELEEENKRLKSLLADHGIPFEACAHDGSPVASQSSSPTASTVFLSLQEKVELFQGLFKGREDVFAKRWYSDTTKKSGYQLCANVNGTGNSATSANTNVQNVLTENSRLYHTNTSSTTLQVRMPMVGMLSAYIRC